MAVAWSAFMPDVLPHVPGAPDPLIAQALANAAREFCQRTYVWREWLACTASSGQKYNITLPSDTQLVRFERATVDGEPLDVGSFLTPTRDWETSPTLEPRQAISDDLVEFTVTGQALGGSAALRVFVSLMPTKAATGITSNLIGNRYLEAIAAGAAAQLLATSAAPWCDLKKAAVRREVFEGAIAAAIGHVARGHTGRLPRTKVRWC